MIPSAMNTQDGTSLRVQFKQSYRSFNLDISFALTQPWSLLFGPSGSGKTTVLRAIGGFMRPASGKIVAFEEETLLDTAAKIFVPPHQRPVRSAAQGARLFPHRTVRENVMFGTGSYSKPLDVRKLVDEVLALFELSTMAERLPRDLSGGEGQKAAVARAVASVAASNRCLLLLDEPFTGLDLRVRDQLLNRLRDWLALRKIPVLSVTHNVAEAFQLRAEVIKLADGRVVDQGPVERVLAEERLRLLAQLNATGGSPA